MNSIRTYKKRWSFLFVSLVLLLNVLPVHAAENGVTKQHQIIFALDGSYSMTEERWQAAVDCVAMITAMLPSDYETAVLVYNEDVVFYTEFGQVTERLQDIRQLQRRGYTNTGLAVDRALESFSPNASIEKRIVIISDGEISMKGQTATDEAVLSYEQAIRKAKALSVKLDICLFADEQIEKQIVGGEEATGGCLYEAAKLQFVNTLAEGYLFEQLGIRRVTLGTSDAVNNSSDISLGDTCAEKVKILVTADSPIEDIQVTCQSKGILNTRGEQFAVIELEQPLEETVKLQYTLAGQGHVQTYLTKEYNVSVNMEAAYIPELSGHEIMIRVKNAEGENLLTEENLRKKIEIYIENQKMDYDPDQEAAVIFYPVEESKEISVRVNFDNLEGQVSSNGEEGRLFLELPPPEPPVEEEESYVWVYVVVSGVCIIFVILLILLILSKKKPLKPAADIRKSHGEREIFRHDFSGKLVIYLLKSPDEADMPPASINLYGIESREPFNFSWVMEKCHMDLPLNDADTVQFLAGADRTLCVKSSGDVTMVNGQEILLRNRKYALHYNEKLLMIFNGGETELEIHYKNIKPSEREG